MKPQTASVLWLLSERGTSGVTDDDARTHESVRCHRLAARIHELKAAGFTIRHIDEAHAGGTHRRYFLIERPTFAPLTGTQEGLPL